MNNKPSSRGPDIDIQKCTEMAGGNRFNLVIMASMRARELSKINRETDGGKKIGSTVTALLEFQNGQIGKEYLKKVK